MTQFQKVNIKARHMIFQSFNVTRMDNGQKVTISSEIGFFAEKLGMNRGSSIQTNGPTFLIVETIDEIKEMMAIKVEPRRFVLSEDQEISMAEILNKAGVP